MYDKKFPPGRINSITDKIEWLDKNPLKSQPTIYPRSISLEDIDRAVFSWFNGGSDIVIDNERVPAFFVPPEKWGEFKQQWHWMDGDRKVDYPYITVRRTSLSQTTDKPTKHRIPGKNFTIYRQPIMTNAGPTYKHFKIPQPVKVDMKYEVRILTHYIGDSNTINETMLRHFASLQTYLNIDNHYMPMSIESMIDETDKDNMKEERIIHTMYNIMVRGYIIDEKEFEEKIGISDLIINIDEEKN